MSRLFEKTEENKALYFFEDISKIPRDSGHEEQIRDYLIKWADERKLSHETDSIGNLIIRKDASNGREKEEPIILQAHMDMVCEKIPDSEHDFSKDPIDLIVDGDTLRADGTTLGADDGIGVAIIIATLDSDDLSHPPIEALITVEEETTFAGAAGAEPKYFKGRRIINLDHADEHQVLAGSCGGEAFEIRIPVSYEDVPGFDFTAIKVAIFGLHGGHSGEDIHRGYGSAVQLLIRLLRSIKKHIPGAKLAEINGGTNRLAISREAEAVLLVPDSKHEELEKQTAHLSDIFTNEYEIASPGIKVETENAKMPRNVLTDESFENIIDFMTLCPDGLQKMNGAVPGVVESSLNVGEMRMLESGKFEIVAEIRGAFRSTVDDIAHKLETLSDRFGGEYSTHDVYSAWSYDPDSKLRKTAIYTYNKLFGEELEPIVVHAGIECGLLMDSFGKLDAISLGPDCWSFHSPDEHTSIKSVRREWEFVKALLAAI